MVVRTGIQFCDPFGENTCSWSMGYGIWGMEYGVREFISDTLFFNLVLAHKTFHTAHAWKYKANLEHNY